MRDRKDGAVFYTNRVLKDFKGQVISVIYINAICFIYDQTVVVFFSPFSLT